MAALATLTPVVVLSGCSGDGNNGGPGTVNLPGGNLTPTLTPTFTPTGTPTTDGQTFTGKATIDGGRAAVVVFNLRPGTGTLTVFDPQTSKASSGQVAPRTTLPPPFPDSIPTGTYPLSAGFYNSFTQTLLLSVRLFATSGLNIVVEVSSAGLPSSFIISSAGRNYSGGFLDRTPTPNPTA